MNAVAGLLFAIFQAFERLEFQAVVLVIGSVVQLCGAVIAIQLHLNLVAFALVSLVKSGAAVGVRLCNMHPTVFCASS